MKCPSDLDGIFRHYAIALSEVMTLGICRQLVIVDFALPHNVNFLHLSVNCTFLKAIFLCVLRSEINIYCLYIFRPLYHLYLNTFYDFLTPLNDICMHYENNTVNARIRKYLMFQILPVFLLWAMFVH